MIGFEPSPSAAWDPVELGSVEAGAVVAAGASLEGSEVDMSAFHETSQIPSLARLLARSASGRVHMRNYCRDAILHLCKFLATASLLSYPEDVLRRANHCESVELASRRY